jgi:hypothetical protein
MSIPARASSTSPGHGPGEGRAREPAATALHALNLVTRACRPLPECAVPVIGGGAIGMLGAARAQLWGAATHGRRDQCAAARLGRQAVGCATLRSPASGARRQHRRRGRRRWDQRRAAAFAAVKPGGVVMHIGLDWASEIDMRKLTLAEITLIGTYTYTTADLRATVAAPTTASSATSRGSRSARWPRGGGVPDLAAGRSARRRSCCVHSGSMAGNPFSGRDRGCTSRALAREELALAYRNRAAARRLAYDVAPVGSITRSATSTCRGSTRRVPACGERARRASTLARACDIRRLPARTLRVTMECAGNGRGLMSPRYPSMPWLYEGVSTAEWTGAPLRHVLEEAGLEPDAVDIAFLGADRGFDRGVEHDYGRSLKPGDALAEDVLLAYAMNGAPLLPQHGFPLRLVVPGWFGMASVKWLAGSRRRSRVDGFQQAVGYHYRRFAGDPGVPITHAKVKSLIVPPGIPDWYTRRRLVERGTVALGGRAWSGAGT